jgi:hypothetical protein
MSSEQLFQNNNINLIMQLKISKDDAERIRFRVLIGNDENLNSPPTSLKNKNYSKSKINIGVGDFREAKTKQSFAPLKKQNNITGLNSSNLQFTELHKPICSDNKNINNDLQNNTSNLDENPSMINDKEKKNYDNFIQNNTEYNINNKYKWPQKTNIRCWNCTLYFDTVPCGIPINYNNEIFSVFGCFCSFNCMVSYNQRSRISNKWEIWSLINLMYKKIYGEAKDILPSPDYKLLKEYGGNLTRKEYKKCIKDSIITYDLLLPPIININYNSQKIERNLEKKSKEHYNPLNFKKIDNAVKELEENMMKNNLSKSNSLMDSFIKVKKS